MRRAPLLALLALAAAPGAAPAQPPIVRPENAGSLPSPELGRQLFAANCASCHGSRGGGVTSPRQRSTRATAQGPSLRGVGRLAADFYLRTGYMPLARADEQPVHRGPQFRERELRALEDYVDSLGGGPPVPAPQPEDGSLSDGLQQFTEHCAGCHQVAAEGGVVTGARVPPLDQASPTQIAEAVRLGPYVMPAFSQRDISNAELDSIIAYVQYTKDPDDRGGWGIDHLGPFPEGIVIWLLAGTVLVGTCMLLGERLRR